MEAKKYTIAIIAGETSGDMYAADLIQKVNKKISSATFVGMASSLSQKQGMHLWHDFKDLSIIGFTGVIWKLKKIYNTYSLLTKKISETKPDLVILIDYAGLNLKIAKFAHSLDIPCFYYIPPKVWAWHKKRMHALQKYSQHIAVLYPFEADFLAKHAIYSSIVKHPIIEKINMLVTQNIKKNSLTIMPGSRKGEINTHLPIMLASCLLLTKKNNLPIQCNIILANDLQRDLINMHCAKFSQQLDLKIIPPCEKYKYLKSSNAAIVVSGTATLEVALCNIPMLIIYKTSWINYFLAKYLLNIQWIGLPNLICQKSIAPELIQHKCNAKNISDKLSTLLNNNQSYTLAKKRLNEVTIKLNSPKAVSICNIVCKLLSIKY